MKRRNVLSISAVTALGLALLPASAVSQQKSIKDQLVGTWTSSTAVLTIKSNGRAILHYGPELVPETVGHEWRSCHIRSRRPLYRQGHVLLEADWPEAHTTTHQRLLRPAQGLPKRNPDARVAHSH